MKGPILALSLMMLISAASALGTNNCATVWNSMEMEGNCITGANFAQISVEDANLFGNENAAIQAQAFDAQDNSITGASNGKTNFLQFGEMTANDTGCGDFDAQVELMAANENCLTIGNITQVAAEHTDDVGTGNVVAQITAQAIGTVYFDDSSFGSGNCVTNGDLTEAAGLDTCVTGTNNYATQAALQGEFDNCLTSSQLNEQSAINANIMGCNNDGICCDAPVSTYADSLQSAVDSQTYGSLDCILSLPIQVSVQYADCNSVTSSVVNQMNCMDEQVTGDCNSVGQFALTGISNDCATASTILQKDDMIAREMGCYNNIAQYVDLNNEDNCVTASHMVQQTFIDTND